MKNKINLLLFMIVLNVVFSCVNNEEKNIKAKGENTNTKQQDTIYRQVLEKLIKEHFYNRYLGIESEVLLRDLIIKKIDSATYQSKIDQLKKKIEKDISMWSSIYIVDKINGNNKINFNFKAIDTIFKQDFHISDTIQIKKRLNTHKKIDMSNMSIEVANVRPVSDYDSDILPLYKIGKVYFSEIFFNDTLNKGILYYSYSCGETCGKGEVLLLKVVDNKWVIAESYLIWIA